MTDGFTRSFRATESGNRSPLSWPGTLWVEPRHRTDGRSWRGTRDTQEAGGRSQARVPQWRGHYGSTGAEFASDLDGVPALHRENLEVMNGVHSNAAGPHRWLSTHPSGEPGCGGLV